MEATKAFECRMCGKCCYGVGGIFLTGEDTDRLVRHFQTTQEDFLSRYCEIRHGRTYLRTGNDGFCVFSRNGKGCAVHPVKPARCALWPFFPANVKDRDTWRLAQDACPGINPECSFEEFARQGGEAEAGKPPQAGTDGYKPDR